MGSLGNDPAFIDNDDLVSIQDRADALGYYETGVGVHIFFKGILNFCFGLHIHRTGAVVQDQNLGLHEQRPGNGNALFLTAGEIGAARLHVTVVPMGQVHDKVMRLGGFGGRYHFLITGLWAAVTDVIAHTA